MFTLVRYYHIEAERVTKLVFGSPQVIQEISEYESKAKFTEGQIFGLQVYNDLAYGAYKWAFYVLEVSNNPSKISFVPNVMPGARILLEVKGAKKVKAALNWINDVGEEALNTKKPSFFQRQHAVLNTSYSYKFQGTSSK